MRHLDSAGKSKLSRAVHLGLYAVRMRLIDKPGSLVHHQWCLAFPIQGDQKSTTDFQASSRALQPCKALQRKNHPQFESSASHLNIRTACSWTQPLPPLQLSLVPHHHPPGDPRQQQEHRPRFGRLHPHLLGGLPLQPAPHAAAAA